MDLTPNIVYSEAPDPKRVLTIVHGLGEHSARYQYVLEWLQAHHCSAVIGDLPGHGRSPGTRGHIEHFDQYISAVEALHESARTHFGSTLPHFLLGHSMGGLIAALAAPKIHQHDPLHGLLLSSPAFGTALAIPGWRLTLGRLLVRFLPRLEQPTGIPAEDVTRSPTIVAAYANDPDVLKRVTLRFFFAFTEAMAAANERTAAVSLPVGVWQAGADKIVSVSATKAWFDRCESADKAYREWPGLYHELLNEPERDEVLDSMLDWMCAH
ncbi:MAG: lysophospholipase [Firmicutes bacterium]|nr:lysophospholipase [Bacillota bacterium]